MPAPAYADGVVYAAVGAQTVVALRASDGALVWQRPDPIGITALSVAQGILLLANGSQLAALRASDGVLLWQLARGAQSPELVDQGVLAALDITGLYAVRLSDGQILWQAADRQHGYVMRLVAGGVAYELAPVDDAIRGVRLSDGALLWQSTQLAVAWSGLPLAVVAGRLYVLSSGLLSVRPNDGYPEHLLPLTLVSSGTPPVEGTYLSGAIRDGVIYITLSSGPPGTVYALSAQDGTLLWQAQIDYATNYVVAVEDGLVFAEGGGLVAARTTDGAVQWRYPPDAKATHYGLDLFPAIGGGGVYLAQAGSVETCHPDQSQASTITAFAEHDGSVRWRYTIPAPPPEIAIPTPTA
jgi:outer membrane protein assembly factor BamB